MSKILEKYIQERNYDITPEELASMNMTRIGIFYGFNTYTRNIKHIAELREAVYKDYPDLSDEDIEVWYVERSQSIRHAGYTVLYFPIPVEDFLKLRDNYDIKIL